MSVESNRSLGAIGSILSFVGIISTIATLIQYGISGGSIGLSASTLGLLGTDIILGFVAFIGFVLFVVAMYGFSKDYAERKIFSYIIYGFIGAIITGVIGGVLYVAFTFSSFLNSLSSQTPYTSGAVSPSTAVMTVAISFASLVWVYFIIKSYNLLGDKSEVPMFKTGAKLLIAGAILSAVLSTIFAVLILSGSIPASALVLAAVPGGIISYTAQAVFAKSFFSIKPPPYSQTYPSTYAPVTQAPVKYCSKCGMQNQADSIYCIRCGRKL